ncbi:MAG: hypothetical protein ABIJ45_14910, partial [Candidatus Zixiibacteriota bacterium]
YPLANHGFRREVYSDPTNAILFCESKIININTKSQLDLPKDKHGLIKDADGCGHLFFSINSNYHEILFQFSCDNFEFERTVAERIGTYNYKTNEWNLLNPFNNDQDCLTPVYHPDGKKIAFLSDNKAYIMFREFG